MIEYMQEEEIKEISTETINGYDWRGDREVMKGKLCLRHVFKKC